MSNLVRVQGACLVVDNGHIVACGEEQELLKQYAVKDGGRKVSASGKTVVPGFVDPHTHLVFAGNRAGEFLMRCQGMTYQDIARAGGGIVASTTATRQASVEDLVELGQKRLKRLLSVGTTTCEVKTGYGLSGDSELRMLDAVIKLASSQPVELVPTFMPAHAFPKDVDHASYIAAIKNEMLPAAAARVKEAGIGLVFQDVFCDEGYFTLEQTRDILLAGIEHGFRPKVHADEFANLGASALAVELGAVSADHLLNTSKGDMELMAASDTVGVLLPGTSFFLNLQEHARARTMIDAGMALALGSDFNPGSCHIYSLPFIWGLACLHLTLTCAEALTALTMNAACAVGKQDKVGALSAGYQADFLILDVASLEEVPYNLGSNPVEQVYKKGLLVHTNS